MIRLSAPRNSSSCFVGDHCGKSAPPFEIGTCCSRTGNGCTKTSRRPVSSDTYAIQRPSGENAGYAKPNGSEYGSPGCQPDTASPDIGRIIIRVFPLGSCSKYDRNLPLGCHDHGS